MRSLALRPYQKLAVTHILENKKCALFMGMGLGKTVSVLTALDFLSLVDDPWPALIIAPKLVAESVWPEEIKKWKQLSHLTVRPLTENATLRRIALFDPRPAEIYTINYENIKWLEDSLAGRTWPFKTIICDESTKLKGFRLRQGGLRTRVLGRMRPLVDRWINLTGTPASNGLVDLWGQTWFLDEGQRLGLSYTAFRDRWFQAYRISEHTMGTRPTQYAGDEIHSRLKDICLAIDAKDWFDLKDPIVNDLYVDLTPSAWRIYKEMQTKLYAELKDNRTALATNGAAKSQKLLQIANGAVYLDPLVYDDEQPRSLEWQEVHDVKLQALDRVIEEAAGAPVLVAYQFRSDLIRLQKKFPQGKCLQGAGAKLIKDWNAGNIPILFAHPQSAGHGLNLQDGGNIIVFFGFWWSREQYAQIIERLGPVRQAQAGHDRPVFIHRIIGRNTIDGDVIDRLEGKKAVEDALIAALKRK